MMTTSVASNNTLQNLLDSQSAKTSTKKTNETEDRFYKLLVAQLQNQDPSSPMSNAEMTSQLNQVNSTKGIDKLNESITKLTSAFQSTQTMQAAGMIGRQVLTTGKSLQLNTTANGTEAKAGYQLDSSVENVKVEVFDKAGATVYTYNFGNQPAGLHTFAWDGKTDKGSTASDGLYSFKVTSLQNGKSTSVPTLSAPLVNGVTQGSDGVTLLTDISGSVKMADVKQIM